MHKHHLEFHDSIQEAICARFGSVSPSLSRRTDFNMESDVLEAYRGDVFLDNPKKLKQTILDEVIDKNISSKSEFREFLKTLGETKTRNFGKINEYEAIKPKGAKTFSNLRDYVFTQEFLKLTPSLKIKVLSEQEIESYCSIGPSTSAAATVEARLVEWRQLRSKQIKYLDGNLPAKYKTLSDADKILFLAAKEAAYYRLLDGFCNTFDAKGTVAPQSLLAAREKLGIQPSPRRETGPEFDTATSREIWVRKDNVAAAINSQKSDLVPVWNVDVDLDFLLAELVITHGLLREKYRTDKQASPNPRSTRKNLILCGNRWLSASDFLTQEMRMPFNAAYEYLRNTVEKQAQFRANLNPRSGLPDLVLWRRFSNDLTKTRRDLQAELKLWFEGLRQLAVDSKHKEYILKDYERFTLFQIKMPKHVRELLLALVDAQHDERLTQWTVQVRHNWKKIKMQSVQLSNWNLYLSYLHKNAAAVPSCLEELRKHAPAKRIPSNQLHFRGTAEAPAVISYQSLSELKFKIRVTENGDVVYLRDGLPYLRDDGNHVVIEDLDNGQAITDALKLADKKWGKAYTVEGPAELRKFARARAVLQRDPSAKTTSQGSAQWSIPTIR